MRLEFLRKRLFDQQGLSLAEVLIVLLVISIIVVGVDRLFNTALSSYARTTDKQDLFAQARHAVSRIVRYVEDTDMVVVPTGAGEETIEVSERVTDVYDNITNNYVADGDGFLDADNDADGRVNEDVTSPDPAETITFYVDKSDAGNWKLLERRPDYSTATLHDELPAKVICEHVTEFTSTLMAADLIEIRLTLQSGDSQARIATRIRSRFVD